MYRNDYQYQTFLIRKLATSKATSLSRVKSRNYPNAPKQSQLFNIPRNYISTEPARK